jgi:formylglycine-generating enzyme required for sulfatase activity
MALIPAGEFQMGSNGNNNDGKKLVHTVYVDAFYIDVHEGTNVDYKSFILVDPTVAERSYPACVTYW